MLTVTTAADKTALIDLATVKSRLGIASGDTSQDTNLNALIAEASQALCDLCGYQLAYQAYSETLPMFGVPWIRASVRPLDASLNALVPVSVTLDGGVLNDYQVDYGAGLFYREAGWPSSALYTVTGIDTSRVPSSESMNHLVAGYCAGWYVSGQATPAKGTLTPTLPSIVSRACWEVVNTWYRGDKRDPSLKSVRSGQVAASWETMQRGVVPPYVCEMIEPYRSAVA